MAALDKYHHIVRAALEKDGWTITHDPLSLRAQGRNIKIDLGAEKLIGAEKEGKEIAVEVKSFVGLSVLSEFYAALGQFMYYWTALKKEQPDRVLYLAVPDKVYRDFLTEELADETMERGQVKLVVYSISDQSLEQWIE